MTATKTIEMGSGQSVILDKIFGPTIFADLRITADVQRGWVIERHMPDYINGKDPNVDYEWVEWCTIPCQLDLDFPGEN